MEQKEFEKRCISLNEEYMQKKVEIEKRLASLKKTRAEIRARMAQQELEYKELGILVQEQEAQLRNLNLQYHHERNVLKMQCPVGFITLRMFVFRSPRQRSGGDSGEL